MKLFASSVVLLFAVTFFGVVQSPKPCECVCGGRMTCPANTTAYCECERNRCSGACLPRGGTPNKEAQVILSVITRELVTDEKLRENRNKYSRILNQLFEGKVEYGVYRLQYEERTIGFSFTEETERDLRQARAQMSRV